MSPSVDLEEFIDQAVENKLKVISNARLRDEFCFQEVSLLDSRQIGSNFCCL